MTPEPELVYQPTNPNLQWALDRFIALGPTYRLNREYYDGKHRLSFASEKMSKAFGKLLKAFSDNLCPTVCETVKDRLLLEGFTVPAADGTGKPSLQPRLDELWRRNRLTVRAKEVHLDALIDGDSYLVVWPDTTGTPVFYPNRGSAIVTEYDDEQPGYIIRAAKVYEKDQHYCLTLYFPDRIEKYITQNKSQGGMPDRATAFIPLAVANEPWPLPNPYNKVPIFHFGNRAGIGCLGISELREAIPVQDALNKSIADMLVASEFYGFPQRWASGMEDEGDLSSAEMTKRFGIVAGGLWATTSKEAAFGSFAQSDISKYIDIKESFKKDLAIVSRTPLHFFNLHSSPPSGESLRVAESPLMAKVKDKTDAWGGVWADAMRFALIIAGAGEHEPEPRWANTATRDDTGEVDRAATKHRELSVPTEVLWAELGYTEKQIVEMRVLADKEQRKQLEMQREQFAIKVSQPGQRVNDEDKEAMVQ